MRKSLVRVAITLIAMNAALAIVILLGGEMGRTGGRILGTSLLATATAILAMVQFPALADRRIGPVPLVAMIAAGVGFAIVTAGIWSEMDSQFGWKVAGTAYVLAVGGAVASVLAGQRIIGRSAWVGNATVGLAGAVAAMIITGIWTEIDSEGYWRFFAVLAVLLAAGGLAVPILSRSSAGQTDANAHLEMAVTHCPFCGADVGSQRASDTTCQACGNRFSVTLHAAELSHLETRVTG